MKKKMIAMMLASMLSLACAGLASAHVTVWPQQASQGAYEVFTVRVPSETEGTETIAVRVTIPEGVNVTRVEPKPDWTYELERREDDTIASVTWQAENGGLAQTEFTEFRMSGKVADDAEELVWRAYQTYADGSVAEWVGAPDADMPASVTTVVPGGGGSDHGHGAPAAGDAAAADTGENAAASGGSGIALALAIAALVLSAAALVAALARRRK